MKHIQTYVVPKPEADSYMPISSMRFVSPNVGWVAGSGQVLRTFDGGRSWSNCYPRWFADAVVVPTIVAPVDATTCWLLAYRIPKRVCCLLTTDSGRSWVERYNIGGTDPRAVFFLTKDIGWIAMGAGMRGRNRLYYTRNAGKNWQMTPLSSLRGRIHRIEFLSERKGWLLETTEHIEPSDCRSALHASEDSGSTWSLVSEFRGEAWDFYPFDDREVHIVGANGLSIFCARPDRMWRAAIRTTQTLYSVHYCGATGIVVGTGNEIKSQRNMAAFLTRDRGKSWARLKPNLVEALWGVYLQTWHTGVLAASGGIYRFQV